MFKVNKRQQNNTLSLSIVFLSQWLFLVHHLHTTFGDRNFGIGEASKNKFFKNSFMPNKQGVRIIQECDK